MAVTKKSKQIVKQRTKQSNISPGLLVSDRVQLRDVRLMDCAGSQKPDAMTGKKTYDVTHSAHVRANPTGGLLIVIAEFHFKAYMESKEQDPALTIDASFVLTYQISNFAGLTQEGFEQFANLNGIYNAWPYWREFVQNMVGRMGLPSLTLPVFRIVQMPSEVKRGEKTAKKRTRKRRVLT